MLDHIAFQVSDVDATAAFYVRVFDALDVREAMRIERPEGLVVGLSGSDQFPRLWFGTLVDPGVRPVHLALTAPSREAVDAVHAAALEAGGGAARSQIVAGVPRGLLRRLPSRPRRQQRRSRPPLLRQ